MRRRTPIATLVEGAIAGAIGAGVQTLFFRATKSVAPAPPPDAFEPPEALQKHEGETETVARRLVEELARRGPLSPEAKRKAGKLVHYGFGAGWGALYALLRASAPRLWSPLGVAGYSAAVWVAADNVILPLFRVAAWPHRYPLRTHAYALTAHLAWGAGVAGTLAAADHLDTLAAVAALATVRGAAVGRRAVERSRALVPRARALVPRQVVDGPRRLAQMLARRAAERHLRGPRLPS